MKKYHTPAAVRHDTELLATEINNMLGATAEATDEGITAARERVAQALERAKAAGILAGKQAQEGVRAADNAIRGHPYSAILIALSIGGLVGCLLGRSR